MSVGLWTAHTHTQFSLSLSQVGVEHYVFGLYTEYVQTETHPSILGIKCYMSEFAPEDSNNSA